MSSSFRTKSIDVEAHLSPIPEHLIGSLEQFTRRHYQLGSLSDFHEKILGIDKSGGLSIFYDPDNKIIGFTRICRQVLQLYDREISVYTGATYHNPRNDLSLSAAKFCLSKAMRYKLQRPDEEMVYIAHANTPLRYQFLAKLNPSLYPQPDVPTPKSVIELVDQLKTLNQWQTHSRHSMLISNQLPIIDHAALNIDTRDLLTNYYLSLNPEYYKGTTLLVYLPINLANISLGIKQILSKMQSSTQPTHA
ncbi:hypothetical protein BN59_00213 [Legionella massiliensis]|uniref:N-acetyltransferase domain-containing protein n=1 Tax=Legionella massiliensis TaxID=1034943 RepID=A0A078KSC3_9GAMM|nr:hypothetical protein [Legionella massiliensis]CDZ75951.1 hypothetical protein BN59_00213 [Legionella massiliensis]CEE11689.1 hypothetical protein BN1094_00213 [Legionella massiliensis]